MARVGLIIDRTKVHPTRKASRRELDLAILDAAARRSACRTSTRYTQLDQDQGVPYFRMAPTSVDEQSMLERIHEALADVPSAPPVPPPTISAPDLLALYPVADAHVGMLAWGAETGETTTRGSPRRGSATGCSASAAMPPADTAAVILDIGDLVHADDSTNQTPSGKHNLDVDTRYYRTLDVVIWTMVQATDIAPASTRR